jgi:carboxyl-terminal processing protease
LSFNKKASNETKEALEELKKQGATLYLTLEIMELLNEAVNICNLFVPKRDYCYYKIKKLRNNSTYKTTKDPY